MPEGTLARSLPKHVFLQPLALLQPNSIQCDVFPLHFCLSICSLWKIWEMQKT